MITPARSRALAILTATAIAVLGLPVSAASAAETPVPGTAAVEGVIRVLPNEEGMSSPEGTHVTENVVTLVTSEGTAVELTGADIAGAETGATFEGIVTVTPKVAALVEAAPAAELGEHVAQAAAELDVPLKVSDATLAPVTESAAAAKTHTIDVMYVKDSADGALPFPAQADIAAAVDRASEYWTSESNGQVAGITRPSSVKYAAAPASLLCDPNSLWEFAAGPGGFGRDYYGNTDIASAHYWAKGNGDHLLVLVPANICGVGNGLGTIGSVHAGGVAWASVAGVATDYDQVVFHELGHNLGLGHSNVTACDLPSVEGDTCTQSEYYDFYDVMGGGIIYRSLNNFSNIGALNASQKVNLGALPRTGSSPGVRTVTHESGATQAFSLRAAGSGSGLRALDIVNQHTGEHYYVEYRSGTGRDANAFSPRTTPYTASWAPGVRVLKLDCAAPATQQCAGAASTVIRNPETGALSFQPGQQFESVTAGQEAPGLRVKVDTTSAATQTATVTVSFDAGTDAVIPPNSPVITGQAKVGKTLTAQVSGDRYTGLYTLQWFSEGKKLASGTATYTVKPTDAGNTIEVWATNIQGWNGDPAKSQPTAVVDKGLLATDELLITGVPTVGNTLEVTTGAWAKGAALEVQWSVDGEPVPGATKWAFSLDSRHLNTTVTVDVTGSLKGYYPETRSTGAGIIGLGTLRTMPPSISGTAQVGSPLSVTHRVWTAGTTYRYQWTAGGVDVAGATGASFTPAPSHLGKVITVRLAGSKAGYRTASITSAGVKIAAATLTSATPTITGTAAKVGVKLTAKTGTWTAGTTFAYQWAANGVTVKGATASTFTPTAGLVGRTITVTVIGKKAGYTTAAKTSKATGKVVKGTLAVATPTITGTGKVGAKHAAGSVMKITGVAVAYQWYANGVVIKGATKSTYTPTASVRGKSLQVKVGYSMTGYSAVAKLSAKKAIR